MHSRALTRLLFAVVVGLSGAVSAGAADLTIRTGREGAPPCDGSILVEPLCDGASCPAAIEIAPAAANRSLALADTMKWRARLQSSNCWAAPLDRITEAHEIVLWPLRQLSFTVSNTPGSLQARLTSAASSLNAAVSCAQSDGKWTCPAPAATIDVRLEADSFAPVYLFDFAADDNTPRRVALERGASISGWVESSKGPVASAKVTIKSPAREVTTNSRGFFQIVGVQPGIGQTLTIKKQGLSTATVPDVVVEDVREYVLEDPVQLAELASLQLSIMPPSDPAGKPWGIRLNRAVPHSNNYTTIASEQATLAGFWSKDDLESGPYSVVITDSHGSVFERRNVTVEPGIGLLPFRISRVGVRGIVRAGEEPLEARLAFVRGGRRVGMTSDEDGKFNGVLPEAGAWKIEVTPRAAFSVISREMDVTPRGEETEAELEIELPPGKVDGMVVDESGKPVRAVVNIRRDRVVAYAETDPAGKFTAIGIEPATVFVEAVTPDGAVATTVPYQVTDDASPAPLRIVLESQKKVEVRLVTPSGAPIPGAIVRQLFPPWGRRVETETGPDGRFTVAFTQSTPVVDAVIFAVGFPVKIAPIAYSQSPVTLVAGRTSSTLNVKIRRAPPWPFLRTASGSFLSLSTLMVSFDPVGPPRGMVPGGFESELEPGSYAICFEANNAKCEPVTLQPGQKSVVDVREWHPPLDGPPPPQNAGRT